MSGIVWNIEVVQFTFLWWLNNFNNFSIVINCLHSFLYYPQFSTNIHFKLLRWLYQRFPSHLFLSLSTNQRINFNLFFSPCHPNSFSVIIHDMGSSSENISTCYLRTPDVFTTWGWHFGYYFMYSMLHFLIQSGNHNLILLTFDSFTYVLFI